MTSTNKLSMSNGQENSIRTWLKQNKELTWNYSPTLKKTLSESFLHRYTKTSCRWVKNVFVVTHNDTSSIFYAGCTSREDNQYTVERIDLRDDAVVMGGNGSVEARPFFTTLSDHNSENEIRKTLEHELIRRTTKWSFHHRIEEYTLLVHKNITKRPPPSVYVQLTDSSLSVSPGQTGYYLRLDGDLVNTNAHLIVKRNNGFDVVGRRVKNSQVPDAIQDKLRDRYSGVEAAQKL